MFTKVAAYCIVVVAITTTRCCQARQIYTERIPNGANVPNWPAVGHVDPHASRTDERNSFGHDFAQAGKRWTKNLCYQDSDNDGKSNGEELGDPDCKWKPFEVPFRSVNITNPGVFNDFNKEKAGADPSTSTRAPSSPSSSTNDAAGVEGWVIAHCIFMALSFGLILPASTLVPFYCRARRTEGKWREDHIRLMYLGNGLGTLGFLIAVFSMGVESTLHGIVGVVVMLVLLLQSSLGYFRLRIPSKFKWRTVHSYLGRAMILLVAFQLFFGYMELNLRVPLVAIIFGVIHFSFMTAVFVAVGKGLKRRQAEANSNGGVMEEEMPHTDFAPLESIGNVRSLQLS